MNNNHVINLFKKDLTGKARHENSTKLVNHDWKHVRTPEHVLTATTSTSLQTLAGTCQ